ncbi:HET-domain-containing protein [Pyrenochaeta sp. DS3sAY3a]|nr:HET-domain-containing protein [Pyrenochaeta sp. DS3sAY3a]
MSSKSSKAQQVPRKLYVGSLSNLAPDSDCKMCQVFFNLRHSTSEAKEYYLYAMSAVDELYGHLARSPIRHGSDSLDDFVIFAVLAESPDFESQAISVGQDTPRRFLTLAEPSVPGYINLSLEDERQALWMNEQEYGKTIFTTIPIKTAIQRAEVNGFIYEWILSPHSFWGSDKREALCVTTSIAELLRRQRQGKKEVHYASQQYVDNGDPDTPRSLGYVPHRIRTSPSPLTQFFHSSRVGGRVLAPDSIDYSFIRGWLKLCQQTCDLDKFSKDFNRFRRTPFNLVDCKRREVIKVPARRHLRYIALSYVWGKTQNARPDITNLPFTLPEKCSMVIEDAITVCLRLGYKYLWVDSLCISPDVSLKHEQIANMDLVYKNAELTIIAAAGSDADYGLPGVGLRQRIPQEQVKIGKHHYVDITSEPDHWLQSSVYQTRGWTMQEYFFSRRKLIFSDSQISFQCLSLCSSVHHQESLHGPARRNSRNSVDSQNLENKAQNDAYLSKIPSKEMEETYEPDGATNLRLIKGKDKVFTLIAFEYHVAEYTKRNLTYEADSLQAVVSILDRFRQESHSLYHLHGIPYMPYICLDEHRRNHVLFFQYGLLWTHGPQTAPTRRRSSFPSWSWAGWEGKVNWLMDTTYAQIRYTAAVKFTVDVDGHGDKQRTQSIEIGAWRPSQQQKTPPKELVFKGSAVIIPLEVQLSTSIGAGKSIWVDTAYNSKSRVHVTQVDLFDQDSLRTAVYGFELAFNLSRNIYYVLLVQEAVSVSEASGKLCFERVGVMMIPAGWFQGQRKTEIQGYLV